MGRSEYTLDQINQLARHFLKYRVLMRLLFGIDRYLHCELRKGCRPIFTSTQPAICSMLVNLSTANSEKVLAGRGCGHHSHSDAWWSSKHKTIMNIPGVYSSCASKTRGLVHLSRHQSRRATLRLLRRWNFHIPSTGGNRVCPAKIHLLPPNQGN